MGSLWQPPSWHDLPYELQLMVFRFVYGGGDYVIGGDGGTAARRNVCLVHTSWRRLFLESRYKLDLSVRATNNRTTMTVINKPLQYLSRIQCLSLQGLSGSEGYWIAAGLPEAIAKLRHLRTLDLSGSRVAVALLMAIDCALARSMRRDVRPRVGLQCLLLNRCTALAVDLVEVKRDEDDLDSDNTDDDSDEDSASGSDSGDSDNDSDHGSDNTRPLRFRALGRSVRYLSLEKATLIDNALTRLSHGFGSLRVLDLQSVVTLQGAALQSTIDRHTDIRALLLSRQMRIDDSHVLHVTQQLRGLLVLQMELCTRLTDTALEAIISGLSQLRILSLAGCSRMSVDAIVHGLTDAAPQEVPTSSTATRSSNRALERLECLNIAGLRGASEPSNEALLFQLLPSLGHLCSEAHSSLPPCQCAAKWLERRAFGPW